MLIRELPLTDEQFKMLQQGGWSLDDDINVNRKVTRNDYLPEADLTRLREAGWTEEDIKEFYEDIGTEFDKKPVSLLEWVFHRILAVDPKDQPPSPLHTDLGSKLCILANILLDAGASVIVEVLQQIFADFEAGITTARIAPLTPLQAKVFSKAFKKASGETLRGSPLEGFWLENIYWNQLLDTNIKIEITHREKIDEADPVLSDLILNKDVSMLTQRLEEEAPNQEDVRTQYTHRMAIDGSLSVNANHEMTWKVILPLDPYSWQEKPESGTVILTWHDQTTRPQPHLATCSAIEMGMYPLEKGLEGLPATLVCEKWPLQPIREPNSLVALFMAEIYRRVSTSISTEKRALLSDLPKQGTEVLPLPIDLLNIVADYSADLEAYFSPRKSGIIFDEHPHPTQAQLEWMLNFGRLHYEHQRDLILEQETFLEEEIKEGEENKLAQEGRMLTSSKTISFNTTLSNLRGQTDADTDSDSVRAPDDTYVDQLVGEGNFETTENPLLQEFTSRSSEEIEAEQRTLLEQVAEDRKTAHEVSPSPVLLPRTPRPTSSASTSSSASSMSRRSSTSVSSQEEMREKRFLMYQRTQMSQSTSSRTSSTSTPDSIPSESGESDITSETDDSQTIKIEALDEPKTDNKKGKKKRST